MDSAVALVQAYLRVNGYFTVTEYPVFEAARGRYSAATDLDVLAVRFPNAGRPLARGGSLNYVPDPTLGCAPDRADMLIGEVKEGKAVLNEAAKDRRVLAAVLARFGCCDRDAAERAARQLLRTGEASGSHQHRIRLIAFGSRVEGSESVPYQRVSMARVVEFLRDYAEEHWAVIRHGQFKDPAFGFLVAIEKAMRGNRGREE